MLLVPVGPEVDRHDAADPPVLREDRGIGAVEGAPGVVIGLFIRRRGAQAGLIQRVGIHDRGIEFTGLIRGVDDEGELLVPLIPDGVDVFQLEVVLEVIQGSIHGLIRLGALVLRLQRGEHVAVEHGGGGLGHVQHAAVDQIEHRVVGLLRQQEAERQVRQQQQDRNDDHHHARAAEFFLILQFLTPRPEQTFCSVHTVLFILSQSARNYQMYFTILYCNLFLRAPSH